MKTLWLICLILYCIHSRGQDIEPTVLASSGDAVVQQNIQLAWTLGETFVQQHTTPGVQLDQGFHQLFPGVTTSAMAVPSFEIRVFPNPAQEALTIMVDDDLACSLFVYDLTGRLRIQEKTIGPRTLNVAGLLDGAYILVVETAENEGASLVFMKL